MGDDFSALIDDEDKKPPVRKIPPIQAGTPPAQTEGIIPKKETEEAEWQPPLEEEWIPPAEDQWDPPRDEKKEMQEPPKQERVPEGRPPGKRTEPRIKLGIEGLDEMLGGGLVKNSVTGIIGTYGTGKTTFAINFIFEGLRQGETCIMISLDERSEMLKESIRRRGYDLDAYLDKTFFLIKLDPTDFTLAVNSIKNDIPALIRETKTSRVVIDPISLFEGLLPDEASRRLEMFKFVERMRDENCTFVMTSETDTQIPYASKYGLVEYLVDCVILLRYVRASDLSGTHLAVEVVKMRRSQHSREIKPYEIQPDDVVVYSEASVF
ncbi:MAG: Putative circadian clock protein, KaiC [Methanomicrobiales archaeon 53_19]|jgi:KaiC domain protein|uniref:KaiC domain-containing protein n=1 Tax=Methanocalculus sp. TaxID=2004547 RepID=UPI00074A121F|nr:MAG: Putative circadian clock protein, KaiC [Methanocalculus sp. 52_23]KUL03874.1 MAG: Putative circadian clock protein, KaiC [Methanomicrobiales archaeon 53_19]